MVSGMSRPMEQEGKGKYTMEKFELYWTPPVLETGASEEEYCTKNKKNI